VAFFFFQKASGGIKLKPAAVWCLAYLAAASVLVVYPQWAIKKYGFDVRSSKESPARNLLVNVFHGLGQIYWTAIARIDVSNTSRSNDELFLYGYAPKPPRPTLKGRVILVDGSAPTRQYVSDGDLKARPFFHQLLWASPYIVNPKAKDVLIIGGGGGIDIDIAKYFAIPRVSVLEMNPATYKHVLLGQGDPESSAYQPWLLSNDATNVRIFNSEARHFCSLQPEHSYDVIQASGVDTLTAVSSGALVNSDNYLYTVDAVKSYVRLLKPGGVLSLTHWRFQPPQLGLKMFVTYLDYLEQQGNTEPWRNLVVIGGGWTDSMLKTTPFTEDELKRVHAWAEEMGYQVLFDPSRRSNTEPGVSPEESIYPTLAYADEAKRKQLLRDYVFDVSAATDNKPYFYQIAKDQGLIGYFRWVGDTAIAVLVTLVCVVIMVLAPAVKLRRQFKSPAVAYYAVFFALSGFAFLLFEVALLQLFSIFVGGPTYSLAVVLVAVLAGYSTGALVADRLPVRPSTFVALSVILGGVLFAAYLLLPNVISALMPLSFPARIMTCALLTFVMAVVTGIPTSLGLGAIKKAHAGLVSWLWGISSGFNALAAASFVFISRSTGIAQTLGLAAILYVLANLLFAALGPFQRNDSGSQTSGTGPLA
jgi:hypothetical protein